MATSKKQSKQFDVTRPGNVAADATARPIIVGHGSVLKQDPMVAAHAPAEEHKTTVIAPPDQAPEAEADAPVAPESSDEAAVEAVAEEVNPKKQDERKSQEAEKQNQLLEEVIASKKYFVPIGEAQKRRSVLRFWWTIFLLLILGVAAVNFAIDADVLDIGVQALTDIL